MRTIRSSFIFLLTFITTTCTHVESGFTLRSAKLQIEPATVVERGTELTLICTANIVYSGTPPLLQFSFFKDYNKHNNVYLSQTNTSKQVTYTIGRARASHTGTYQCEAKVGGQYAESSSERISVKGLQTPVLSIDKHVVTEGDSVRVTCRAKEESGELSFFIKNVSSEIYHEKTSSGEVQKNLSLKHAGTAELSCSYVINLGSEVRFSDTSNVVGVSVRELDFKPTIRIAPSPDVIEGDSVHISCGLEGQHHGSPSLSLSKGSLLLKTENVPEYKAVVLATDSGRYECSAIVNNVEKNVYANLTVRELFSTPVLSITPAEVFEKQQFTVTCTSFRFASERIGRYDVKYSIYKNNQELGLGDGTYRDTARAEANGNYTCAARVNNTVKWSRSTVFTAKVLISKPTIGVLGEVVLGRSFLIECHSNNGSFPITYTLKRNYKALEHTRVSGPFQKAIFNATIQHENEIHQFRCEAQNNGPSSARMSDVLLAAVTVPVQKPTLMTLPEAVEITEDDEVSFLCFVTKGTPPISFKWYQDQGHSPLYTVTVMANFSVYSVPAATSVHSGRYHCEALNGAGKEQVSDQIVVTVKMARWKKGLIIGVCLLCVTGLFLALLLRYMTKRVKVASSNGPGIWSERPPVSDSSEGVDVGEPEEPNVEYTEVLHPRTADPARVPLRKGTETVYSEVQSPSPDRNQPRIVYQDH